MTTTLATRAESTKTLSRSPVGKLPQPLERDVAAQSEMQIVDTFCGNSPAATILLLLLRSTIMGLHSSDSKYLAVCGAKKACVQLGIDEEFTDSVIAKLMQFATDGARNQWPKDFFA